MSQAGRLAREVKFISVLLWPRCVRELEEAPRAVREIQVFWAWHMLHGKFTRFTQQSLSMTMTLGVWRGVARAPA